MANLGEVVVQIRAEMAQFKRAFKDASRQLMSFTRTSRAALSRLSGAVVAFSMNVARHIGRSVVRNLRRAAIAMAALGVASVKAFSDFQGQMAQVSTMLTRATMHLLPGMTKQVQELSIAVGQSTKTLTEGLFDILSAQIPAAQAMKFLATASETAVAGSTDVKTATSALITVMEAYGKTAADVNDISDVLFTTMFQGRINFADVAQNIGTVAAQAAIAKVDLESMASMFAVISRILDPFKTQTALRALYTELRSPTEEQKRVAKDIGIEWNSAAFSGEQLVKTLLKLKAASVEQLDALMPNVRGFAGLAAAIMKAKDLQEIYDAVVNSSGSTAEAYAKIVETMGFQFKRFGQALLAVMRSAVEPFSVGITKAAEDMANWLRDNQDELRIWAELTKRNLMVLVEFVKLDFTSAVGTAIKALLVVFKGLGKSLMVVFENIFVTLGANFFVWIRMGMRQRKARDLVLKELSDEYLGATGDFLKQAFDASWGGPGARVLDAPTFDEAVLQRTATKLDQLNKAEGDLKFQTISLGDTVGELGTIAKETVTEVANLYKAAGGNAGLEFITRAQVEAEALREEWEKTFSLLMKGVPAGAAAVGGADTDDVTSANEKAAATVKSIWKDTSDSIAGAMSGAFADIATSAKSMTEALTDMLNQIHRALSQEVFMQLLWPSIKGMVGLGAVAKTEPTGPQQPFKPMARGGLVGQGMGRVMYAASGLMVPRGGDTVPIMATPGEEVVEKPIVDYIKRTQAQPPAMTINVNSVTGRDAYAFLNDNKRTIASMMQSAMSGNHPLRRDR